MKKIILFFVVFISLITYFKKDIKNYIKNTNSIPVLHTQELLNKLK